MHSESDSNSENEGVIEENISENDISAIVADKLYAEAGTPFLGVDNSELTVLPEPRILLPYCEKLILEAKDCLKVNFELEPFQVQSLLGIIIIFFFTFNVILAGLIVLN